MRLGEGDRSGARQGSEHEAEAQQRGQRGGRPQGDAAGRVHEVPALRTGSPEARAQVCQPTARFPDDARRGGRVPGLDQHVAGRHANRVAGTQDVVEGIAGSGQPDLSGLDAQRATPVTEVRSALVEEPGLLRNHHSSPANTTPL